MRLPWQGREARRVLVRFVSDSHTPITRTKLLVKSNAKRGPISTTQYDLQVHGQRSEIDQRSHKLTPTSFSNSPASDVTTRRARASLVRSSESSGASTHTFTLNDRLSTSTKCHQCFGTYRTSPSSSVTDRGRASARRGNLTGSKGTYKGMLLDGCRIWAEHQYIGRRAMLFRFLVHGLRGINTTHRTATH